VVSILTGSIPSMRSPWSTMFLAKRARSSSALDSNAACYGVFEVGAVRFGHRQLLFFVYTVKDSQYRVPKMRTYLGQP
jgi:hypothetical protein